MKASTHAHVHPGGRLGELHCEPPLTLRRVHGERDECALCLVGSAAGPLPGDELALHLTVDPGARASLVATGASIAQGRGGEPARLAMSATVGADGSLVADPGPLIVSDGARVVVGMSLTLGAGAALEWRELVVLGRSRDENPGDATIRWDVIRDGRPVLRQNVDLRAARMSGGHRVIATALVTDPQLSARTAVRSPVAVAQRLDDTTVLATVLGHDAAEVRRELASLLADVRMTTSEPASR